MSQCDCLLVYPRWMFLEFLKSVCPFLSSDLESFLPISWSLPCLSLYPSVTPMTHFLFDLIVFHSPLSCLYFFLILFSLFTWWFHMTDIQVFWVCLLPDHICFLNPFNISVTFSTLLFLLGCFCIVSFFLCWYSHFVHASPSWFHLVVCILI